MLRCSTASCLMEVNAPFSRLLPCRFPVSLCYDALAIVKDSVRGTKASQARARVRLGAAIRFLAAAEPTPATLVHSEAWSRIVGMEAKEPTRNKNVQRTGCMPLESPC